MSISRLGVGDGTERDIVAVVEPVARAIEVLYECAALAIGERREGRGGQFDILLRHQPRVHVATGMTNVREVEDAEVP